MNSQPTDEYTKKKASFENLPAFKQNMKERYDQAFLGILQNETRIEPFIDSVMSFLQRKTDFFRTLTEESKVGFPPGVAENMMRCYFMKYNMVTKEAEAKSIMSPPVPKALEVTNPPTEKVKVPPTVAKLETQEQWQNEAESHNGAQRDKYSWNQNHEDVDITISTTVANSKLVKVNIQRRRLTVTIDKEVIVDDELQHEIKKDDSTWSLEKGKALCISLTKATEHWWSKLVMSEEEIDMKKIRPERGMETMGDDEAAIINRLQFDDIQKKMGNPQSHELKVHDMLKKGWNAEGSPFKGQEFDPSKFDINQSAVQM